MPAPRHGLVKRLSWWYCETDPSDLLAGDGRSGARTRVRHIIAIPVYPTVHGRGSVGRNVHSVLPTRSGALATAPPLFATAAPLALGLLGAKDAIAWCEGYGGRR